VKKVIRIGGGEPEYRTPSHIVEAMVRAMEEGRTHYGDFRHILELREAVAAKYQRLGVDANPEWVIITPGSTMGIYMVFKTLMAPGEEFITMDPCFFGYYEPVRHLGIRARTVPRYKGEDWGFHPENLYGATTDKTRALLICSPDNPTGAVMGDEELGAVADYAEERDVTVISDDIYDEITYDGVKFKSVASLPGMAERTVILNGLSKTYAMTGWRVGYIIAPSQELYDRLFSLQMASFLVVNAAIQHASLAALTGPQDCVREMVADYGRKRRFVVDAWRDIPRVAITEPKGAFYAFPDISEYGLTSAQMSKYLMDEAAVAVTPGHLFGANGEGHVRNAFAQSMSELEEALTRIRAALAKL
jgi:aspartate/methionine/tyrosine aminotransferase